MTGTSDFEPLENIASKLIGRDCYVLLSSQGADFGGQHIGGLYGRRLDLQAKGYLQSVNRWQGRRPAVYIDDKRAVNESHELSILVHELGHYCDLGHDDTPEDEHDKVFTEFQRRQFDRTKNDPVLPVTKCDLHGDRFARACLHLWWRCYQAGHWFSPDLLYQGELYGIPSPGAVSRAMGDELQRLQDLPVRLILDLPSTSPVFDSIFKEPAQ